MQKAALDHEAIVRQIDTEQSELFNYCMACLNTLASYTLYARESLEKLNHHITEVKEYM